MKYLLTFLRHHRNCWNLWNLLANLCLRLRNSWNLQRKFHRLRLRIRLNRVIRFSDSLIFWTTIKKPKSFRGGLSHLFYPETSSTLHQSHLALHRRRILSVSRKFRPDRLNSAHLAFPMAPSACWRRIWTTIRFHLVHLRHLWHLRRMFTRSRCSRILPKIIQRQSTTTSRPFRRSKTCPEARSSSFWKWRRFGFAKTAPNRSKLVKLPFLPNAPDRIAAGIRSAFAAPSVTWVFCTIWIWKFTVLQRAIYWALDKIFVQPLDGVECHFAGVDRRAGPNDVVGFWFLERFPTHPSRGTLQCLPLRLSFLPFRLFRPCRLSGRGQPETPYFRPRNSADEIKEEPSELIHFFKTSFPRHFVWNLAPSFRFISRIWTSVFQSFKLLSDFSDHFDCKRHFQLIGSMFLNVGR